ncbi:MAG: hypothetical protein J3K34DRAFT_489493 [Monoraphidium minutum]|nr:MAG: hypothetical protein J3K34DRAFT_489493 [Monoraphidium minutum]
MEPAGPLTALWVVTFALSNVYVACFLSIAYFNAHPEKLLAIKTALRRVRGDRGDASAGGGGGGGGGAAAAAREPRSRGAAVDAELAEGGGAPPAGAATNSSGPRKPRGSCSSGGSLHVAAPDDSSDADDDGGPEAEGGSAAAPEAPPLELEWRALSLVVPGRKILQGIYGAAAPGELQALMGPSGAGKSTLLDILAMRLRSGQSAAVGGAVLANGRPRCAKQFLAASAYVPQHDNFVPTMTAEETVGFHAAVVLAPGTPRAERAARAGVVLRLMGLTAQRHTLVGGTLPGGLMLRGLSGGERRRLAIACGVVAGPSLVFLDEPTSGLDSFAALSVSRFLRRMADGGHTLLASVTLLSQGRLMYHGPTPGLVPWFAALGYAFDASLHGSASDWALDVVTLGFTKGGAAWDDDGGGGEGEEDDEGEEGRGAEAGGGEGPVEEGRERVAGGGGGGAAVLHAPGPRRSSMRSAAELRRAAAAMQRRLARERREWSAAPIGGGGARHARHDSDARSVSDAGAPHAGAAAGTPPPGRGGAPRAVPRLLQLWVHFRALLWREAVTLVRNPADVAGRMATFAYVGLLNGLIFYSLSGQAATLQDRVGACYGLLSFFMLMPFVFMGLFWSDRTFYVADTAARLYHPVAYYAAKVTAALPFNVAVALSFHLLFYAMAGLRHGAGAVAASAVISVLMALIATQARGRARTVYLCATIAPSQDTAFMLAIAYTALNLLACGYLQRFSAYTLQGLTFLRYVSAMNWAWEGMVGVELQGRELGCGEGGDPGLSAMGLYTDLIPDFGLLGTIGNTLRSGLGPGCVADADVILDYYGMAFSYGQVVAVLAAFLCGTTAATYLALYRAARRGGGKRFCRIKHRGWYKGTWSPGDWNRVGVVKGTTWTGGATGLFNNQVQVAVPGVGGAVNQAQAVNQNVNGGVGGAGGATGLFNNQVQFAVPGLGGTINQAQAANQNVNGGVGATGLFNNQVQVSGRRLLLGRATLAATAVAQSAARAAAVGHGSVARSYSAAEAAALGGGHVWPLLVGPVGGGAGIAVAQSAAESAAFGGGLAESASAARAVAHGGGWPWKRLLRSVAGA